MTDDDRGDMFRALSRRQERRAKRYFKELLQLRDELDRLADRIDDVLDAGRSDR